MSEFSFNPNAIEELLQLRDTEKFQQEDPEFNDGLGYVGLLPAEYRPLANNRLNESIDRIIFILENNPSQKKILDEFLNGLDALGLVAWETEDRERVCSYYDQIREIIGFDSTEGILNDWLY